MDLITKYKNRIAELQKKQKTFEAKGRGGACISLQGEIQAYNTVICDLVREGYKPDSENGKLPIPHVSGSLPDFWFNEFNNRYPDEVKGIMNKLDGNDR